MVPGFGAWEGLVSFSMNKVDDEHTVGIASYVSLDALKSNAENVKAALGRIGPMMAKPPERHLTSPVEGGSWP